MGKDNQWKDKIFFGRNVAARVDKFGLYDIINMRILNYFEGQKDKTISYKVDTRMVVGVKLMGRGQFVETNLFGFSKKIPLVRSSWVWAEARIRCFLARPAKVMRVQWIQRLQWVRDT